ncbi:MAG: hypothetical protein DMG72_24970 [Acidobacteria bacterium]|nr:MAG: hypothetical protein DMG72_24970 [Acidobacteriota bacterium]
MDIALHEAVDLLSKWKQERRRIHYHIFDADFSGSGLGLIEELSPKSVRIDNRHIKGIASGQEYGCEISLLNASFTLWDWRNVPPEEKEIKEALHEAYDIVLRILLPGGVRFELHGIKFLDVSEIP